MLALPDFEKKILTLPQSECPVSHFFGDNIYIRQVVIPAGTFAIGHKQKTKHLNIFLSGVLCVMVDGIPKIINAPLTFVSEPGQKIGYAVTDVVWQNVYATSETDIDKLEDMFIEKSEIWNVHNQYQDYTYTEKYRLDYKNFLNEYGFSEEQIRKDSERNEDVIELPIEYQQFIQIRSSHIEGKGVFLSFPVRSGAIIAPCRINEKRTTVGRYLNHSPEPNCVFCTAENENIYIKAKQDINGCIGGNQGTELTVDYRQIGEVIKCQV